MAGNWRENLQAGGESIIERCLRAVVEGPFIEEWEFHTLIGLDRGEVRVILDAWPSLPAGVPDGSSSADEAQRVAVVNSINNLLGYPDGFHGDRFTELVGAPEPEVRETFRRVPDQ